MGSVKIDIGAVPINVILPEVTAGGRTLAHLGGNFTIDPSAINLHANAASVDASTEAFSLGIGAVTINDNETVVTADHDTEAFISPDADLTVDNGPLTLTAESKSSADAESLNIDIGAVDASVLKANAKVLGTTKAYVGSGATVNAHDVSLIATSTGNSAIGSETAISISLFGGIELSPHATLSPTVEVSTGSGSDINTNGGTLTLSATSGGSATAKSGGVGITAVGASSMHPDASAGGDVTARIDGSVETGALLMSSTATLNSEADVFVVEITLGGGAGADATAEVTGTTAAAVGGSAEITATGNVQVQSTSTGLALSDAEGGAGGAIVSSDLTSHANNSRTTRSDPRERQHRARGRKLQPAGDEHDHRLLEDGVDLGRCFRRPGRHVRHDRESHGCRHDR